MNCGGNSQMTQDKIGNCMVGYVKVQYDTRKGTTCSNICYVMLWRIM